MEEQKALKTLNSKSAILPVLISFGILAVMFWRDDQLNAESLTAIAGIAVGGVLLALLLLLAKDFLNMSRFRFMSHGEIDLKSAFYIVLFWEFTVAVAPPLMGATTVLIFILFKEGVPFGKALAYAMLAASLDNLFFLLATPLAIWWSDGAIIPDAVLIADQPDTKVEYLFWLSYTMIIGYTSFMLSAIVLMPKLIFRLLTELVKIKFLKRFEATILEQGKQLLIASKILRGQKLGFWLKLIGLTSVIWILKYGIVGALASGYVALSFEDQLMSIGKHLVMWVTLLVSPSPGNAGTAEFVFPAFYGDQLGTFAFATSIIWRMITYYPYLLVGAIILPMWLKRKK